MPSCATPGGRILEVLGKEPGEILAHQPAGNTGIEPALADRFPAGRLFSSCLDAGSVAKSLAFQQEIRARHATFEWELQLGAEEEPGSTLCFDGGRIWVESQVGAGSVSSSRFRLRRARQAGMA